MARAIAVAVTVALAACSGGGDPGSDPVVVHPPPVVSPTVLPVDGPMIAGLPCAAEALGGQAWSPADRAVDLDFVDGSQGWLVTTAGGILHTADAGRSWQQQDSGVHGPLANVVVNGSALGWVWGTGLSLVTADGGRHWRCAGLPPLDDIGSRWLLDDGTLVVTANFGGNSGKSLVSHDGGVSWQELPFRVDAVSTRSTLFGVGSTGLLARSIDRGRTALLVPALDADRQLAWLGSGEAGSLWAVVGVGIPVMSRVVYQPQTIFRSDDDGATWVVATDVAPDRRIGELHLEAGGLGLAWTQSTAAGPPPPERAARTTDGGRTWVDILAPNGWRVERGALATLEGTLLGAQAVVASRVPGGSLLSSDGGVSWRQVEPGGPSEFGLASIKRETSGSLIAFDLGQAFRSLDQGLTWERIDPMVLSAAAAP